MIFLGVPLVCLSFWFEPGYMQIQSMQAHVEYLYTHTFGIIFDDMSIET